MGPVGILLLNLSCGTADAIAAAELATQTALLCVIGALLGQMGSVSLQPRGRAGFMTTLQVRGGYCLHTAMGSEAFGGNQTVI